MCGLIIQFTATTDVNKCQISAGFSLAKKSTPENRAKQRIPRDLASSFCLSGTLGGGMASLAAHEPLQKDSKRIQQTCLMPNPAPYAGRIPAGLSAG